MAKVVIFNGPPNSGKDYIGEALLKRCEMDAGIFMYKERLYQILAAIYGYDVNDLTLHCKKRSVKDIPTNYFEGLSPRQALIKVSEEAVKPAFGDDYFGKVMLKRIFDAGIELAIITDAGFVKEVEPLVLNPHIERIIIVRLFAEDCSFDKDSRNYLSRSQFGDYDKMIYMDFYNRKDGELDNVIDEIKWLLN